MKKIFVALVALLLVVGCQKEAESYKLSGTTDFEDGTLLILSKPDEKNRETGMKSIDTMVVKDGKFELKGTVDTLDLYYIKVDKTNAMTFFVLENSAIEANIYKDSIQASVFKGTKNNEALRGFISGMKKAQNEMMAFQNNNNSLMQEAVEKQDTVTQERLRNEFMELNKKMETYQLDFVKENTDALFGVIVLSELINNPDSDVANLKITFDSMTQQLKDTKYGKKIAKTLENLSAVEIGKKAPNFKAKNPEGQEIGLMDNLGSKVTIIDFWASWCRPCRIENPNMVALYNDFKDKGLAMIGVSLDQEGSDQAWKDAIAQDNLTWNHVSNLKFWDEPIAVLYNVKSIPAVFILDANGIIVAKNIRGAELRAKVAELVQ